MSLQIGIAPATNQSFARAVWLEFEDWFLFNTGRDPYKQSGGYHVTKTGWVLYGMLGILTIGGLQLWLNN